MKHIGTLQAGPRGSIADVTGVTVGHCTLAHGDVQTRPVSPWFDRMRTICSVRKCQHAACIVNGFGKSVGLVQVDELGVFETPIALTNTFSVGAVAQAQIRAAIETNPLIGRNWPSVNPLVFECNDSYLNDMQAFAVEHHHYREALDACSEDVVRGAVSAGRGMSCFDLKGGIGSAFRVV